MFLTVDVLEVDVLVVVALELDVLGARHYKAPVSISTNVKGFDK